MSQLDDVIYLNQKIKSWEPFAAGKIGHGELLNIYCYENNLPHENVTNQLLLNSLYQMFPLAFEFLDFYEFPNGNTYYNLGVKNKAKIVHNNWMVGIDTKINKFKGEGLWFI